MPDGQQNQSSEQQQTSTTQNTETNNQSTNNNDNNNNPPASSDRELLALYDQVMREREEENRRLREELEEARKSKTETPPLSAEEQKTRFFNEPYAAIREVVQNELKEAVGPLREFTSQFQSQNKYEQLKQVYRTEPRYKDIFPKIEATVDQMMARSEKNEANLRTAVLAAIGLYHTGMIPGQVPDNPNPNPNPGTNNNSNNNAPANNNTTPAHLRSTPPSAPVNTQTTKTRELTENEKRVARMRGLTDEQYLALLNAPASAVATMELK